MVAAWDRGGKHCIDRSCVRQYSCNRGCAHSPNTTVKTTTAAAIIAIAVNTMLLRPYGQSNDFFHADDVNVFSLNNP